MTPMKLLTTLVLLCVLISSALSQADNKRFRHLTVQDGLSRSWVKCLLQDSTGYLWAGTADGLSRYNGISFKTYNYSSEDKFSLNHNNILLIYEDRKKNLWVGTQEGLNLYDRKRDRFSPVPVNIKFVTSIYEYDDGRFLVGSPGGLYFFNPQDTTSTQIRYDINIEEFLYDSNHNLWMATYHGLYLLNTNTLSCIPVNPDNRPDFAANFLVRSLFQDSKGRIWIGTDTEGLYCMTYSKDSPGKPQFANIKLNLPNKGSLKNGAIYAIGEDESGLLWVGVENSGLCLIDLNTFSPDKVSFQNIVSNMSQTDGLSDNSVHCIYRDKQNTMWIGTHGAGLNYYNEILQKFAHHKHIPGNNSTVNNNKINAIYEDNKYLWIGTEEGVNQYDKNKQRFVSFKYDPNNPNTLGSNAVLAIRRDSRNNLWVGTWRGGLNLLNESTMTFRRFLSDKANPGSIGGNNIYGMTETKDQNLWIASMLGGLNVYDYRTGVFQKYLVNYNRNSISGDWVIDVLEASDGNIWISTTVAVDILNRKTGRFVSFRHNPDDPRSISYNSAFVLFEDSRKNMWIGTSNGLNLFNKKDSTFRHFKLAQGLPSDVIRAIEEDNKGNLWLSTNNGISKFVNAVHTPEKPAFINYNVSDGLQGNEFNSRSSFKNKDGFIYFGGNNGYNVFNPDAIKTNPYTPNIVFTRLLLFNKPVGIGEKDSPLQYDISNTKELKLRHQDNIVTIEFAALNLLAPENNQYSYTLEGFEKNWNNVGNQHFATYTNLDPGKYTFRVKASNNDGLWNNEGISLDIIIMPAWWQTNLAKVTYILLFLLIAYFVRKHILISIRLKNELWREHLEKTKTEELSQLKNQFFTNVSHELRTPLTLILGPLKKLIPETPNNASLQTIYRNAARLKVLVDQILDISKIENRMMKLNLVQGNIVEHLLGCSRNFIEFAQQKEINFRFKSSVASCYCHFDADKTEKIVTNILSNAFKNTPANGSVMVNIDYNRQSDELIIGLSDTGKGIDPSEIDHIFDRFFSSAKPSDEYTGTGIGLDLTKKLVELHRGTISVSSIPGNGATFTVTFPFGVCKVEGGAIDEVLTERVQVMPAIRNEAVPIEFIHEKRILVIDDNAEMCDFIQSILADSYDVIKVTDSTQTFNHILDYMPDLIISDVMMPGINGFELVKQVRGDVRFSHIPVILLTAKVTVTDHVTGYDSGADDYIYKPFEEDILKARIKNLIAQQEKLRKHFIGTDGIINNKIKANDLDIKFVDNVLNQIKAHYTEPDFNVNDIIDKMGMSRSIFYKKFKALSDQSVNDLIKGYRLKKAAELISSGSYSVSEVAYECGFSDPAYFSKVFKEFYKISPKDYSGKR